MFRSSILFVIISYVSCTPLYAFEKANLSVEQLQKTATHIVVGQVVRIYSTTESEGSYQTTNYAAEVRVEKCEKGDGIAKDQIVYVRYWRRQWIGKGSPPPGTSGHRGLPNKGDSMRIYLARNAYDGFYTDNDDGGLNVIGANGFEKLESAPKK